MFKCEVCGNEFEEAKENHYIARDKMVIVGEPTLYDAYDCPKCGSQIIAKERKGLAVNKNAHKAQNAHV